MKCIPILWLEKVIDVVFPVEKKDVDVVFPASDERKRKLASFYFFIGNGDTEVSVTGFGKISPFLGINFK
jgi:hypothetical protein